MNTKNAVLYFYAETPLHAGTGTGLGAVDMPIQREKHTYYPIIQASGVKGALRDTAELGLGRDSVDVKRIFGGASGDADDDHAGAFSPSDARILCFPVRALNGVFIWISTAPILNRYLRETGMSQLPILDDRDDVIVSDTARLLGDKIMLEEFAYPASHHQNASTWAKHFADKIFPADTYWNQRLATHFAILPDNEFRDFVRYSTEIITRIKLNPDTKVVDKEAGALFTQELLPADSILYSSVRITDTREKRETEDNQPHKRASEVYNLLRDEIGTQIQIGADETVGRGRTRLSWQEVN